MNLTHLLKMTHALIGCDWGTRIATDGDIGVCENQAVRRVCLHAGEQTIDVKVCAHHLVTVTRLTDPHQDNT